MKNTHLKKKEKKRKKETLKKYMFMQHFSADLTLMCGHPW